MAAALKITTRAEWEARAFALAQERRLIGTPHLELDGDLARHYTVPNADRRGNGHQVSVSRAGATIICDCVAGTYGRPCSHVGAVLHAERQRKEANARGCDEHAACVRNGFGW